VIRLTEQFVPVKVNAEKGGEAVAKKYKVRGFPTILFINPSGEVESKIGGYMPPSGFSQQLEQVSWAHANYDKLTARAKTNSNDGEAAAGLAAIYAWRSKGEQASAMLAVAEKSGYKDSKAMARAYNAVGDFYQEGEKFDKAVENFDKAIKVGKDPNDIAYAQISAAVCYFSQNKPKSAAPYLKLLVNLPGAPKEYVEQAKQMLAQADK
jgi:tetratricopeptide (TPR) repeat protein